MSRRQGERGPRAARRILLRALRAGGLTALAVLALAAVLDRSARAGSPFRLGLTTCVLTDVNENDARASIKALALSVAGERRIDIVPEAETFPDLESLGAALDAGTVDAAGITVIEFFALDRRGRWGAIFVPAIAEGIHDTYCLLIRRDAGIARPADLAGRQINVLRNARSCLAEAWLGELLRTDGRPDVSRQLQTLVYKPKLSPTVLPVFFQQADACVVTQSGFAALAELNPQVGSELRVLASSSPLVTTVVAFRADYESPAKAELLEGLRELHTTPSGRQVLAIFKSTRLVEITPAQLDSARRLYRAASGSPPLQAAGFGGLRGGDVGAKGGD